MPVEGRGLSSRQTQQAVRDREIGQPNNSETCSKAADGVARESEGRSRLSLLRALRQDQPRRHPGTCLCPVPLEQGRTGRRRSGLCGYRRVWGGTVAGGTGACAQGGDIPTGADQTRVHTEGQRQTQAAGHLDRAGSGLHDSSDAGAGADLLERSLGTRLVIYADDLVILCRRGNAEAALHHLREIMGKLKLTVNEDKTRICRVPEGEFDVLGLHVRTDVLSNDGPSPLGSAPVKEEHPAHGRKGPR